MTLTKIGLKNQSVALWTVEPLFCVSDRRITGCPNRNEWAWMGAWSRLVHTQIDQVNYWDETINNPSNWLECRYFYGYPLILPSVLPSEFPKPSLNSSVLGLGHLQWISVKVCWRLKQSSSVQCVQFENASADQLSLLANTSCLTSRLKSTHKVTWEMENPRKSPYKGRWSLKVRSLNGLSEVTRPHKVQSPLENRRSWVSEGILLVWNILQLLRRLLQLHDLLSNCNLVEGISQLYRPSTLSLETKRSRRWSPTAQKSIKHEWINRKSPKAKAAYHPER
jgi:hypothetical protein